MGEFRVEMRRCQHIKTNGTQCGSPALRNEKFCFFHSESRPERVQVRGEDGKARGYMLVPVFEDANAIQVMVRQVAMLLLGGKIDSKKAGQVLYALQIASSNLRQMEMEKPRPVQVVVDPEKVAETPLGMTPWSEKEGGHEREDIAAGFRGEMAANLKRELVAARERYHMTRRFLRKEAEDMRSYLNETPALEVEKLRWVLATCAARIEEGG